MCGSTARLTRWVPRTLTSYCWPYCSGVKASAGPNIIWPALCTTTSMRPLSPTIFSTAALVEGSDCTSSSTARRSTPSRADIDMTREIAQAAKALKITIHDHLVIGRGGHASFKSLGLL